MARPAVAIVRKIRAIAACRALGVALALAAASLPLALEARADSIEPTLSDAESAFAQHARSWMADLERSEAENRRTAPVYQLAAEAVVRFDGYGDEYETTVKATGHPTAPFVGILRYEEVLYTCLRDDRERCTVSRAVPVSEIFSFRNGRWTY